MTIVHCPRCRDEVTVPAKASPRALVRCPLCLEEYLLSEALAEMPPALLIVGGEMDEEPALVGAGASSAEAGGDYALAGGGYGGGVFDSSAPAGATVAPARTGVKTGARPRRKEKSAIGEMIKIVLGGVIGLSLGLLVLWWGLHQDPLNLGPKVSPYAPWIVPAEFRHTSEEAGTTAQNANAGNPSNPGNNLTIPPKGADGSFRPAPGVEAALDPTKPVKGGTDASGLETLPDPLIGGPGAISPVAPASIDLPTLPLTPTTPEANPTNPPSPAPAPGEVDFTNLLPGGNSPAATTNAKPAPAPPAIASPDGNESAVAAADLAAAVQAANDAIVKVDEATANKEPKEVRQQLFTDLYLAAADAGRVISHLDPADADVAEPLAQLKKFLGELAGQPGKVSAFSHLGRTHLPQRKAGEGFVIAGKVIEYRVAGSVFETTLDAGSDVKVFFVSLGNPQDFCEIGDQLLIAGRIVDEPAKNIKGYDGEAARVMLLGESVQIPKAE